MASGDHKFWAVVDILIQRVNTFDVKMFDQEITELSPFERHLLCAFSVDSEICNGGFAGCFGNSTGICTPLAIEGLRAFGRDDLAGIVAEAMVVCGDPFPRDEDERWDVVEALPGGENHFDALDSRYWELRTKPDIYDIFDEQLRKHSE